MQIKSTKILLIFIITIIITNTITASSYINHCFNLASIKYQIPAKLLKAIAKTETNFNPLALHINANKTYDFGIMQINSSWLTKLNRVGITRNDLMNTCTNIQIGAWILAHNIKQYGFTNKAIGIYNSPNFMNQERYARKVLSNFT